ncbi:S41 family peptidase [Lacticaseibacillus kribbianus]|uniref:S41 family peptidase n=1 Tax=Lacticaseibacillus kribbianus TaxID=2926292 RepID=UPI001CD7461B|nr:S41 family peptidase [Lacticaseibacillus kribbianus]
MAKIKVPVWLMAVGMSVTLVGGAAVGYATRGTVDSAKPTQAALPAGFNKVLATYATIQGNYYKDVSATKLADGAVNGMLSSLDDPYSVYLQNSDKTSLDSTISASFGGIGATVQQGDNKLTIESILADTPAKKAGLQVGDQLLEVNGKSVEKLDVNAAVAKIRGKIGTKVKVTVRRDGHEMTFTMTRAKITTDTVTYELAKANKQVGVITMATFSEPTASQFKKAVKALRKEGAKRFVLDLRGNPGGMLDTALQIASMCLKDGQTIVKVRPRTGKTEVYLAGKDYDKGFKVTEPLAVVIDGNSASASEILSAALNQNGRGPLVGVKSFGKGTVQNVAQMSATSELKLTIAKWLTPNGSWIHHKGLKPTIKVDYPDYAKIGMISSSSLKAGDQKQDVKSLQEMLKVLGFDPKSDNGFYGPTTQAAVKAFQTANKLDATGTADTKTIAAVLAKLGAKYQGDDPMLDAAIKAVAK